MTLNPQVEALLAMMSAMPPVNYSTITPDALRALHDQPMAMGPPPTVERCESLTIALADRTIDARLYVAETNTATPPLLLYFHGGGWVIGTLDTHDATCRALARASGAAVLSIAYRLAPEHPFPAGLDDCFDALLWASENGTRLGVDAARLAVGGDSAGGNLAAAVAIRARDEGGPTLRHQLLLYPVTDRNFTRASFAAHGGGGGFLSTEAVRWFWDAYLDGSEADDLSLAVIHHRPDLAKLPPATVITAEYDPLCDEGMAYARRLAEADVPVDAAIAPGMIHGFVSLFEAVPDAQVWIDHAGARLRDALQ